MQACIDLWNAAFITLNGRQMITFEDWKWNNANGGMRFAFPPYGLGVKTSGVFFHGATAGLECSF